MCVPRLESGGSPHDEDGKIAEEVAASLKLFRCARCDFATVFTVFSYTLWAVLRSARCSWGGGGFFFMYSRTNLGSGGQSLYSLTDLFELGHLGRGGYFFTAD